ncbi:biopolymer transporter ExbD [uncultured Dokdonia sp.]|uniref:ExbD/TolR family protein n=1 Tax=uncultured Dokdonia sp. TaxID=575653 RepID=UPI00260D70C0|nr:biopolymer transporter ExbD [uncultured Dokdonia sp.]
MKYHFCILFVLGSLFISCQKQSERVEYKLINCIYETYDDQGTQYKKAFFDFEQSLITEKILEDTSGKSYKALFEKMATENTFSQWPSSSFMNKIAAIDVKQNVESYQNCIAALGDLSQSKLQSVMNIINQSNTDEFTPAKLATKMLEVLDEEDFELEYYKMNIFVLFETINYTNDSGLVRKLPAIEEMKTTTSDVKNAIKVALNGENKVLVNGKKVSLEELKSQIHDYVSKNTSESMIIYQSDRKASFAKYVEVQEAISGEIKALRATLAKERYHTDLEKLTKEQLTEIRKVYPMRISEKEPQ